MNTALAEKIETPVAEPNNLLAAISRAASDPNVDIEKMERLMQMHERMCMQQAEQAFNQAMNICQANIRRVAADSKNRQTGSDYASQAAIDRDIRPIYTGHGFSLSFDTEDAGPDMVKVVCYVSHSSGHTRKYNVSMPSDGKGSKGGDVMTKTHATGSALTYGQRYLTRLIFNIATGKDDDGNIAGLELITAKQVADLEALITEIEGFPVGSFMSYLKNTYDAESYSEIPARAFKDVVAAVQRKRKGVSK